MIKAIRRTLTYFGEFIMGRLGHSDEVKALRQLAKENTPIRVIGIKLGRAKPLSWAKPIASVFR
jgi:hypothetical protein